MAARLSVRRLGLAGSPGCDAGHHCRSGARVSAVEEGAGGVNWGPHSQNADKWVGRIFGVSAPFPLTSAPRFPAPHVPYPRTPQCDEAAMGLVAVLLGECMPFGGEEQVRTKILNAKCARGCEAPRCWAAPAHGAEEATPQQSSANLMSNALRRLTPPRTQPLLPPLATPSPPTSAWPSISRAWRPCAPCPPSRRVRGR